MDHSGIHRKQQMIMRRILFAVCTALMILSGCEYHPYYDGQEFCVYNAGCGLLETDGGHAIVPTVGREPYVLEFYGGKGENHSVEIEDPEILGYSLREKDVNLPIGDCELIPAGVTLLPKKIGDTSITVKDEDTGKSIQIYIHVREAYKAIQVCEEGKYFDKETIFAFRFPSEDNAVRICRGSVADNDVRHVAFGTYRFITSEDLLYFEISFPADEDGRPAAEGNEVRRIYQVQLEEGGSFSARVMFNSLNINDYMKDCIAVFRFVDETDVFYARSAQFITWNEDE